ncbi:MAG TPA: hypothetical protein VGL35_00170 [Rhizomicrobium sp.]|jgi:hypothetical protein
MRILAWLIHGFFDPMGIVLGLAAGLVVRRRWHAALGGAALGALATTVVARYHHAPMEMRPTVTAAIVSGGWGFVAFLLRRWLSGAM